MEHLFDLFPAMAEVEVVLKQTCDLLVFLVDFGFQQLFLLLYGLYRSFQFLYLLD